MKKRIRIKVRISTHFHNGEDNICMNVSGLLGTTAALGLLFSLFRLAPPEL